MSINAISFAKENSFNTENDYYQKKYVKMNQLFDVSTQANMVSKFLSGYIFDQLNIPEGFNNLI
jgi:hypothetical protein